MAVTAWRRFGDSGTAKISNGQRTDGHTVRTVCKCCCAVAWAWAMWRCGVACHHSIPTSQPRTPYPSAAAHTTYPHRLPQLARRQSHFTPTKLRKWQANEPSNAILLFVAFLLHFLLLLYFVIVVVVLTLDAQ